MTAINYQSEAVLYCSKSGKRRSGALTIRRFTHASDAIRYAIEELTPERLASCSIEIDDDRLFGKEIRPLYDSDEFPLLRKTRKR
jgi:hypothetical protein